MTLDALHTLTGKLAHFAEYADSELDAQRFTEARHDLAAAIAELREASIVERLVESERPPAYESHRRHEFERQVLRDLERKLGQ